MRSMSAVVLLASAVCSSVAAMKTSIYIDEIPGYSKLAPCAEERISAIVRAQASGCGDDMQLTSFSCFCIDHSTMMSSLIATAVQERCAATATSPVTAPLPDVTQAGEVFNAYCARSTELAWYQNNSTSTSLPIVTPAPSLLHSSTLSFPASTSPASSTSSPSTENSVPVAAIAAPVVIGVVAIAGIVGLLFWLRRRRTAKANGYSASPLSPVIDEDSHERAEIMGYQGYAEAPGDSVKYRHELETRSVEPVNYRHELETKSVELEGNWRA